MKRIVTAAVSAGILIASVAAPVSARDANAPGHEDPKPAVRYDDFDSRLGTLDFLGNNSGFHLWFTVQAGTILAANPLYEVGNSYHNVYKWADQIDDVDPAEWCVISGNLVLSIPNLEPYNLSGGIDGSFRNAYVKVWNVTTESWVCGSDGT